MTGFDTFGFLPHIWKTPLSLLGIKLIAKLLVVSPPQSVKVIVSVPRILSLFHKNVIQWQFGFIVVLVVVDDVEVVLLDVDVVEDVLDVDVDVEVLLVLVEVELDVVDVLDVVEVVDVDVVVIWGHTESSVHIPNSGDNILIDPALLRTISLYKGLVIDLVQKLIVVFVIVLSTLVPEQSLYDKETNPPFKACNVWQRQGASVVVVDVLLVEVVLEVVLLLVDVEVLDVLVDEVEVDDVVVEVVFIGFAVVVVLLVLVLVLEVDVDEVVELVELVDVLEVVLDVVLDVLLEVVLEVLEVELVDVDEVEDVVVEDVHVVVVPNWVGEQSGSWEAPSISYVTTPAGTGLTVKGGQFWIL